MSLYPDDRSRARDRSSTRDRDRSRSNVRSSTIPGAFSESTYEIRPDGASRYTEYSKSGAPYPPEDRYDTYRPETFQRDARRRQGDSDDDDNRRRKDDSDDDLAYGRRQPSRHNSEKDDYKYSLSRTESQTYKTSNIQGVRVADDGLRYSSKSYDRDDRDDRRTGSYETRVVETRPENSRHSSVTYERDRITEARPERKSSYYEKDTIAEIRPERKSSYYEKDTISEIRPERKSSYYEKDTITEIRPDDRRTSSYDSRVMDITPRNRAESDVRITRTTSNSLVPGGLVPAGHRLSISGGSGGLPPPSPLLEAYHGTYQQLSPMPMAMRLEDDMEDLSLTKHTKIEKKRVKLYDPEADARALAKALNSSNPDAGVICDILPPLSDDQIWELRKEYKKQVKIQGKGINLSKHLKMKLSGNFGKVVYVTALGRWESEGYWANFFYQSHGSRRELLIESLMGRTNADIRSIKDEFKDKRYNDDLVRCMDKELKPDKFRTAILMALEGRRQEEQDTYPQEYRDRDVEVLQRAMASKGGESAMLEIVVRRSDAHLREILRQYERMYGENFARVVLKKSSNLVGEVMAHILNGVINKPARDALLLRHAIKDIAAHNKDDELRYELLISRLVRLHWDRLHLMRVKKEYKDKYGKYLEEDLEDSLKGDFRDFVCELCDVQGPR